MPTEKCEAIKHNGMTSSVLKRQWEAFKGYVSCLWATINYNKSYTSNSMFSSTRSNQLLDGEEQYMILFHAHRPRNTVHILSCTLNIKHLGLTCTSQLLGGKKQYLILYACLSGPSVRNQYAHCIKKEHNQNNRLPDRASAHSLIGAEKQLPVCPVAPGSDVSPNYANIIVSPLPD